MLCIEVLILLCDGELKPFSTLVRVFLGTLGKYVVHNMLSQD